MYCDLLLILPLLGVFDLKMKLGISPLKSTDRYTCESCSLRYVDLSIMHSLQGILASIPG